MLQSADEAEAIACLNYFLSNIGKKPSQDEKVLHEEHSKVCTCVCGGGGGARIGLTTPPFVEQFTCNRICTSLRIPK